MVLMGSFMAIWWLNQPIDLVRTWKAVCIVESGGKTDAIGDKGAAVGIAQIHKICVDDVNRIIGKPTYTYTDRLNPSKSFEMFRIYVLYYFPNGGPEQWSRCWNGGPRGPYKSATLKYWQKVQRSIQNDTR